MLSSVFSTHPNEKSIYRQQLILIGLPQMEKHCEDALYFGDKGEYTLIETWLKQWAKKNTEVAAQVEEKKYSWSILIL